MPLTVEEVKVSDFVKEFTLLDENIFYLLVFIYMMYCSIRLVSCI
jgi:hypothetical protein